MYKVQGLIFDLDGTLVHLPIDWKSVVRYIENLLGVKVKSLLELLPKIWGTEKYEIVSRKIEEYELASLDGLTYLDNSPELLKDLSSKYPIGLMTFQGVNVTRIIIAKLGLSDIPMATRDDDPTRVDQITRIVTNTPLNFNDVLVVGDRLNDVYSALKSGCQAALVDRQGRYYPKRDKGGFIVIPSLRKLPELLTSEALMQE